MNLRDVFKCMKKHSLYKTLKTALLYILFLIIFIFLRDTEGVCSVF